jgi:hypothetical protein
VCTVNCKGYAQYICPENIDVVWIIFLLVAIAASVILIILCLGLIDCCCCNATKNESNVNKDNSNDYDNDTANHDKQVVKLEISSEGHEGAEGENNFSTNGNMTDIELSELDIL